MCRGAWLVLAAVAWVARAGPGPPAASEPPEPPEPTDPLDTLDTLDTADTGDDDTFRFSHALYNLTIPENSPPRTYAAQLPDDDPLGVRLPTPHARIRFRIKHGDKDKFFKAEERCVGDFCFLWIRTRAGHADVLNRERRDNYRLQVRATAAMSGGRTLHADTEIALAVTDVNDLSPLFYPTEYDVAIREDAPPHSSVTRVTADDADLGLNGEIYYSFAEPTDRFAVHPTSGLVTTTRPLRHAEKARHELTVMARDRASLLMRGDLAPAARARLTVRVQPVNLHAPELHARYAPEAIDGDVYAIVTARDRDEGEHGRVASVDIVDGDPDGHFRVRPSTEPDEWDIVAHALLDRDRAPDHYNLTLRASDAGTPQRSSYLSLSVRVARGLPPQPVFSREIYEASVSEMAPPGTPLVRLKVAERDERVYMEIAAGNEGGEFQLHADTGVLYTTKLLDAERQAHYTLTVAALDRRAGAVPHQQTSAKVKVLVIDANDNDPVFEQSRVDVRLRENGPAGSVVTRLIARDADSGENAYVTYSIANLQPVPFDVEHFSGAIRTTRVLDYESMKRSYVVRVRASDWGLPYRRQAEAALHITLEDVNDNRPQFERVDCVGYLPRRLPMGSEILTLSAIDFDSGDVVSYRIVSGNEDGCFALDTNTGVLTLACDLETTHEDLRRLNVTATDGTHFADATSLQLHAVSGRGEVAGVECRDTGAARRLTALLAAAERSNAPDLPDEPPEPTRYGDNLHAPEFIDFPVEVKVNESVALGTSLVRLHARDRDLGYNGLLQFGISGGDDDSVFRIDPDTGELKVIGYLDREREPEYFLNVTVYDCGEPRRAASRLLPVTVLDVNDDAPHFQRTLLSYRVTENALNGTAICRLNATDRDSGEFGRVTYSLEGAGADQFCIDATLGTLRVCAPLDRETRSLYELSVWATDGGGRRSEARVRISVDDVNDVAPRFPRTSYSARVREDEPVGVVVAVLEALDPDLGAGGELHYSLPEQAPEDAVFTIDETSGVLRLAKTLDYEDRQVYGVTVRATDGGAPALWGETSVVIEVLDVDENQYAPVFPERVVSAHVSENATRGTDVVAVSARDADAAGRDSRLSYYVLKGSGMGYFSIDDAGMIRTTAPLDRERTPHYWLTVCAEDHALVPKHSCVPVYIEVSDVNDVSPWFERAEYRAEVDEHAAAGTRVLTVRALDADDAPEPAAITYRIVAGNPAGLFSIDENTGEIVTTGRTLDRETAAWHALDVQAWDGARAGSTRVRITLRDLNDHAPAFTQRYYQLRVPLNAATSLLPQGDEPDDVDEGGSAEGEGEDEDEGAGKQQPFDVYDDEPPQGVYVGTVLALDGDAGVNGSVWYSARGRGAARGVLRVHRRSGRVLSARPLQPARLYELTVRACDGGRPARCGVARVSVRTAAAVSAAHNSPPTLPPPPPLQAAELDAPGFLLALLQATDPDDDPLYYDIVDGDPEQQFVVGREDGSLVLARRLLWERRRAYALNVSVTDTLHTVYTQVNVTVINDINEGGVAFSREEYVVDVDEETRVGEPLVALRAAVVSTSGEPDDSAPIIYGIHACKTPASLELFRLNELTGVLELAKALDRETASIHELTVWARDTAPRASLALARVKLRVHDADDHAPEWPRRLLTARVPSGAPAGALIAQLHATDRDHARHAFIVYSLAGDDAAGLFTVDASTGEVHTTRRLPPPPPHDYTLQVRAANPTAPRAHVPQPPPLPLHVLVVEPDNAPPRFSSNLVEVSVSEDAAVGTLVASLEASSASAVRYATRGGRGAFRVNPAAGTLHTDAQLDYEECSLYNLTVIATNMGGGTAEAQVTVRVLDVNEYPPEFTRRKYRGRVSEDAALGALVREAGYAARGGALVLLTVDRDSSANQQRAFTILEPDAAATFSIDPVSGAVALAAPLNYETRTVYNFTVKVIDMGSPRLTSSSSTHVSIEVTDVNDEPPQLEQNELNALVLLPAAPGLRVLTLDAPDPDLGPAGKTLYDIIEGDNSRDFRIDENGVLLLDKSEELLDSYSLRVRASDGQFSSTARVLVRMQAAENAGLAFQKADYFASVVENSTRVVTVTVLDVLGTALGEHVHYQILNPVPGFEIGKTSGAVRTTGVAFDREACDNYTLLVEASTGVEGPTGGTLRVARSRLHIAVTDVNDNCPVFVELPYVAAARAGDPPGTHLLTVHAVDLDANDNGEVRYEMKRGNGELFSVERRSGLIALRQTLEQLHQEYTLLVAAFDGGTPACGTEAKVVVRVWAGGAAPHWPAARAQLSAREDAAAGTRLAPALLAHSPLQRQLIYTLLSPKEHPQFQIHFDTGWLEVSGPLDYETDREHALVVRATDGVTGAHADLDVIVRVLDVNDNAPEFERDVYRATVPEDATVGTVVLQVHAQDNDTGPAGEVWYSVSAWAGGGGAELFTVDASGTVRVAAVLDAEATREHHLLLRAADRAPRPNHSTAHLFITVEDVNDNPPVWERGVWQVVAARDAARGQTLAAVRAHDPDAHDAHALRYALHAVTYSKDGPTLLQPPYSLHPVSGAITLVGEPAAATLNVSACDGAYTVYARVRVSLAPHNAHAPHFAHVLHEARVRENMPPPVLLTTVKAFDEDPGEYGTITYSIPSTILSETFSVDAVTGAVSTRVPLDREARAEWLVPLLASDGGAKLAHTTLRVRVQDENDNAPAFPLAEYRAAAALTSLAPFLHVTALDGDDGDYGRLSYSLYAPPDAPEAARAAKLLHIESVTGALSFASNATELGECLSAWVRARDGGGRSGTTAVTVCSGSPAPLVSPPRDLFLPEDAAAGTLITELRPADAPPAVTYRLAPAAPPSDMFALDDAGRLVLAGTLDRETQDRHYIGVIASDPRGELMSDMVTLVLHVLDVNEHAPRLHAAPYVLALAEDTPPGTELLQVMADDLDAGSNGEVRYSLVSESGDDGAEEEGYFSIDPVSGWVVTRRALDRETAPEHRVAIMAADGGSPRRASRGSLVVRLRDYNDSPPVFSAERYEAEVREDAAPGTVLLRLPLRDPDLTASAPHYALLGGDPTARFALRDSGELYVARALDRETQDRYELRVLATDGKFSAQTDVVVTVIDVNDNPPYYERYRYRASLREDAAVDSVVLNARVLDEDLPEHARVRHFLTGDGAEDFALDKDTGRLTVARPLDRETRAQYQLEAHAQDRARAEWECRAELHIDIEDVNDNDPRFTAARYDVTLPEDAEPGTLVAKVHALDADLGDNRLLRYELIDETGVFSLASDSGILTLREPLDRETTPRHRVPVRAVDAGSPPRSATALVLLTVADVNDNPPRFERRQYAVTVPELDAPGTELLRVHAISEDAGVNADVYYSIVGGDERGQFSMEGRSGVLALARPLDYETQREYSLTIQAVDGGEPPLSDLANVNVTVLDVNDNAPIFSQNEYTAKVREDAPVGERVMQVIAEDVDSGLNGRVAYSIARGHEGRFSIDADTGYVSVAAPLDRETRAYYELEVRAKDRGLPAREGSALLRVTVLDANDNAPVFSAAQYAAVVRSERAPGLAVLRLLVSDVDAAPNAAPFTFDFQSGNEQGAFRIEQDGTLRTAKPLNHRVKDHYLLQVRVFDNGTPPLFGDAMVSVRVVEESQYPPVVTPLEVTALSYRDQFPGGTLARVHALDRDQFDTLTYALQPPHQLFRIDASSGELWAAPRIDPGEYTLNVTVTDGKFTGHAPVGVAVRLLNDDVLAQAVVVRFRAVSELDFVLSHRKGFLRAVREAMECELENVLLLSVQQSEPADADNELRRRRQVAADLDVAIAVRGPDNAPVLADAVRRRLHAHLERLEERARLVIEELVRAPCGACPRVQCVERLEVDAREVRSVACDVFALVHPPSRLRTVCSQASETSMEGTMQVLQLKGESYLSYGVEQSAGAVSGARLLDDELSLSLQFRTRAPHGTLLWAAGRVDRLLVELRDGQPRLEMELGAGVAAASLAARADDGEWHALRVERRGGWARLQLDRLTTQTRAPQAAASLDLDAPLLHLGAQLLRHAHAHAPEQITRGFIGCLRDVRVSGTPLPLEEEAAASVSGARVSLLRRVLVRTAPSCAPLRPPTPCDHYPCINGGTCDARLTSSPHEDAFTCTCHERYSGARCEVDTEPCAGAPCLHGGLCSEAGEPPGYRCACAAGLAGARCELGRYCPLDGTMAPVCLHGGACEEGVRGPVCRCRGYFGPRCQYDVDECAGEPCLNGATCLNEPGSFRCLCPPDKTGMNCGNPLYSDAVTAGGASGAGGEAWRALWAWAERVGWPLWAGIAAVLALILAGMVLALACGRGGGRSRKNRDKAPPAPLNSQQEKLLGAGPKLSNLSGRADAGAAPRLLNNMDTLRSYGSAGDELEGMPRDYRRNLNLEPSDRKPWSEQMHLHTFTDNKIYNDLKGAKTVRVSSPVSASLAGRRLAGAGAMGAEGVYHWDCSDWCGSALPGITEVAAAGERRDSSSPPASPRRPFLPPARPFNRPVPLDTSSGLDDDDRYDFADGSLYPLHPDQYLPPPHAPRSCGEGGDEDVGGGGADDVVGGGGEDDAAEDGRALRLRDHDASSLITMLEERRSLLCGEADPGSCSDISTRLCEIEDSDAEESAPAAPSCIHTDV